MKPTSYYARPEGVLTAAEYTAGLEPMFRQLFLEQLDVVMGGRRQRPTIGELFAARRRAACLWQADRLTGTTGLVDDPRVSTSRDALRAHQFAEMELRRRLTWLLRSDLAAADAMLGQSRALGIEVDDGVGGSVVEAATRFKTGRAG